MSGGALSVGPTPDAHPRLALVGLRGSGKSSVGRALAAQLGAPFVDLDLELCDSRAPSPGPGASAGELLAALGEPAFRELELAALERVAARPGAQVLATGGGVVETPRALDLLRRGYTCVWLRAPLDLLERRIAADPTLRPRLAGKSLAEELERLAARREPCYQGLAQAVIEVEGRAPLELAQEILAAIGLRP